MDEELRQHIQRLREDFSKDALDEKDVSPSPDEQFRTWMRQALEARIIEPQAMTLSTVSAGGRPSSRIVYLREFGNNTFTFYTNYRSRKATELLQNPLASLTFFWPHLERQVRIEGKVEKAPAAMSDAYFANRPYESQLGAWASQQSTRLGTRRELDEAVSRFREKMPQVKMKRPDYWGGLTLKADYYEFWQGRKSRLHDRLTYTLEQDQWNINRLSP